MNGEFSESQHENRSWTGKIRLQGRLEHAMTAVVSISEIHFCWLCRTIF
jgi:hypothetical protein